MKVEVGSYWIYRVLYYKMVNDYQENYITGWIKLFRSFVNWEWFTVPNMVHLFIYCLIKANHKDNRWRGIEIKRGSFITSLEAIKNDTGLSIQSIRTCLKRLEKSKEINKQSNKQYTVITICNYDTYQSFNEEVNTQVNRQLTKVQQTTNKQLTTNNNDNNIKNDNNINSIYKKFVAEVKNHGFDERIEALYMNLKIKKGQLTPLLKEYKNHLISENRLHKDTNEFFINFKNWLNVQDRIKKLDKYR